MLEVANISVAYGQHRALTDAALNVGGGEIVVILGANGAGKTSLLKAIAGIVACLPGKRVTLSGRDIAGLPAHEIVEAGLALVPEGRGIFADLTVAENLLLGANPDYAPANTHFVQDGRDIEWTPTPRFTSNSADAALQYAEAGGGITRVLAYQAAEGLKRGRLKIVLAKYEQPALPIHIVYPTSRLLSAKVRAFVDLVVETAEWRFG